MAEFGPVTIVPTSANNMTGTAVVTSTAISWRAVNSGSIQAKWTGTPTGTFSVQASLDYVLNPDGSPGSTGTWSDLGISMPTPAGSAGNSIADVSITGILWVRIVYTNASGTGTLTVTAYGK